MAIKKIPIPFPSFGLDKYNEPILGAPTTPGVQNMHITPTCVKKRKGVAKLGSNLPLTGTGMEILQYIDALGAYHTIALTISNAYQLEQSENRKVWQNITPSSELDDCEDAWTDGGNSHTQETDTDDYIKGSKAVMITLTSEASDNDKLAYEDFAEINLQTVYKDYDDTAIPLTHIGFWIKCSIATAVGDLELVVGETSGAPKSGDHVVIEVPALTANTWTFVQTSSFASGTGIASLNATISIALYAGATIANGTIIRVDDVRAYKPFTGDADDRWSYGMVYDQAEFGNGYAALMITNNHDKPLCFEGASGDVFKQHANNISSFATVKELVEFWNHLIFMNYTDSTHRAKETIEADVGNCDDFSTGTSGAHYLTDSVGSILRASKIKAELIVYSEGSITICSYIGSPQIFIFPTLVYESGLWAERGVVPFNDFHLFIGTNQKIYKYEGRYYLDPVGEQIEDAFFSEVDPIKAKHVVSGIEPNGHRAHFFFPNTSDTYAKRDYTINYKQKPMTWEYHEYSFYIRGIATNKNEYGWFCDGPEVDGVFCNESSFAADDTRTQEGGPVAIIITDDGYVYQLSGTAHQDVGSAIDCYLDTGDIMAETDEYVRIEEFGFEGKSNIQDATADIYYSTDSGNTWTLVGNVSIASGAIDTWAWHRIPEDIDGGDLDVSGQMIRLRIRQNSSADLQIRRRYVVAEIGSPRS